MEKVTFKKPRTLNDIKNLPFVYEVFKERDGGDSEDYNQFNYWVNLKDGYFIEYDDTGCVHQRTIKDLIRILSYGVYKS